MNKLTSFNVGDMADQYASAMSDAREMISTRLAGVNSPVIQHVSFLSLHWTFEKSKYGDKPAPRL